MNDSSPLIAFIVGHSRGATTWMSRCLGNHPDVSVFGESMYWGRKFVRPSTDVYYSADQIAKILNNLKNKGITGHGVGNLRNITNKNISEFIDEAFSPDEQRTMTPAELFLKICTIVANKEHKARVIEKTPHHINFIDRIKKALPQVKFVIMLREPYGFMLSYKHQQDRLKSLSAEEKRQKQRLYHPFGCSLVWKQYARSARRAIIKYPGTTHLVKFEHIIEDPQAVLRGVLEFLNLSPTEDILSSIVGTSFTSDKKPKLKSEDYFWMNFVSGSEMTAMSISRQWKVNNWFRVIASILKLPFWAIHVAFIMSKEVEGNFITYLYSWVRKTAFR